MDKTLVLFIASLFVSISVIIFAKYQHQIVHRLLGQTGEDDP